MRRLTTMETEPRMVFRYESRYCAFVRRTVWAILTRQPDGEWRAVNCLDKDTPCFEIDCAFTTDQGAWPYEPPAPSPDRRRADPGGAA